MGSVTYSRTKDCEIIQYIDKPFHYPEHNHASVFTLGFVLDGSVTLISGGQRSECFAGSHFVIPPYTPHELILPEKYKLLTICLQSDLVMSHTSSQIVDRLICASTLGRLGAEDIKKAVEALYGNLPAAGLPEPYHKRAMSLRLHSEDQTDVEEMAKADHISLYHFIRAFKRAVGITPHQFQLQNRIRKTQRLIESGMPLADVAAAAGFFDQSHFNKSFKKIVGLTPLEYKQSFTMIEPD